MIHPIQSQGFPRGVSADLTDHRVLQAAPNQIIEVVTSKTFKSGQVPDDLLEANDYIQWLFPLSEPSRFNAAAQISDHRVHSGGSESF
jgi:hypothetical protein